ncbi:MAG: hypothetical protein ABIP58_00575 [Dehalococcoidia bacterium]
MNRFLAAGGLIVGLVIGAFAIAAVGAQEDTPTPTPSAEEPTDTRRDAYKEKLAENLGISVEDLETAIKQTHLDLIDEALADGRIDEERAAELRDRVENGEPLFLHHGGPGGHNGPGGLRGIHWIAESAKDILGLEDGELRQAYADGKSLADLAEEKGVSVEDLKSQLLDTAEAKLAEKVTNGDITQEQADNILERLTNNIDDIINNTPPEPPADREGLRFGAPRGGFAPAPFFEQEAAEIDA